MLSKYYKSEVKLTKNLINNIKISEKYIKAKYNRHYVI
jgi:hypothetical protein